MNQDAAKELSGWQRWRPKEPDEGGGPPGTMVKESPPEGSGRGTVMSNPPNVHGAARPHDGDVLIAADASHSSACTVSVVPGPQQLRCESYDEALAAARTFAWSRGVSLWFTNNGTIFTALSVDRA